MTAWFRKSRETWIYHFVLDVHISYNTDVNSGRKGEKRQEIMDGVDPSIQVSMILVSVLPNTAA